MGLGLLPLWEMDLRSFFWVGLDSKCRMGAGLGLLASGTRLHRLGALSTQRRGVGSHIIRVRGYSPFPRPDPALDRNRE